MSADAAEIASQTFEAQDISETERLAATLVPLLTPGLVVALHGQLGAGKTRLVQAIAARMGYNPDDVTSPTFTLVQEYDTTPPLVHIDAYRLADSDEFLELGGDEIIGGDAVSFIEWAERIRDVLPRRLREISIEVTGDTSRRLTLTGWPRLVLD